MIRGLLKIGTVALAGYAAYSIYDFMASRIADRAGRGAPAVAGAHQRLAETIPDFGTEVGGARMTGGGRGESYVTEESTGTKATHRVGRGVIRR